MTNSKTALIPTFWLSVAALVVLPACDKSSDSSAGTAALISNGVDDDQDGETDEGDETQCGRDDDDDGEDDDDEGDGDGESDDDEEGEDDGGDDDEEEDDDACHK